MFIRNAIRAIRRRWILFVAVMALCSLAGFLWAASTTSVYAATSSLLFNVQAGSDAIELNQASTYLERAMTSYTEMTTSPLVLQPVITSLGLNEAPAALAASVQATNPLQTTLLYVTVTDPNAKRAADIANAIGKQLTSTVQQTSPTTASGRSPLFTAVVIASADTPTAPTGMSSTVKIAMGIALGAILAAVAVWCAGLIDRKLQGPTDFGGFNVPLIGRVTRQLGLANASASLDETTPPEFREQVRLASEVLLTKHPELLAARDPSAGMAKRGATPLTQTPVGLLVTSTQAGEGKSTIVRGLAESLAGLGLRTLVVDGNLRRPQLTKSLAPLDHNEPRGLVDVLDGTVSVDECLLPTSSANISFLPAGKLGPRDSGAILATMNLPAILNGSAFDVLIIDGPEFADRSDAASLTRACSSVIFVVAARGPQRESVDSAIRRARVELDSVLILANKVHAFEVK